MESYQTQIKYSEQYVKRVFWHKVVYLVLFESTPACFPRVRLPKNYKEQAACTATVSLNDRNHEQAQNSRQ